MTHHRKDLPTIAKDSSNETVKIDKNIPLPTKTTKYPWIEMEVGDSFYVFGQDMRSAAYGAGRRHNRKFAVHKEGTGMRVWRTA